MVFKIFCQCFSRLCLCVWLSWGICSIAIIFRCNMEWPGKLKCMPTGLLFLSFMLDLWLLSLSRKDRFVSPTYCILHFWHVIKYMMFVLLHVMLVLIGNCLLFVLLWKFRLSWLWILHVLHVSCPQPLNAPLMIGSSLLRIRICFKLREFLYAIMWLCACNIGNVFVMFL